MNSLLPLSLVVVAPLSAQIENMAPAGIASQSSTIHGGIAEFAIDGNTDSNFFNSSTTHTQTLGYSWWQVSFSGQLFAMYEIRLFNRGDCCELRLSNFRLSVFQAGLQVFAQDFYTTPGTSVPLAGVEVVPLPPGLLGDLVRVQLLGFNNENNGFFSLAEVEIDGERIGSSVCGPAVVNSAGTSATISALGSAQAGGNPLCLVARGMPSNRFGYFLTGRTQGSFTPPGSVGRICLSGNIGRYNGQIRNTQIAGNSFGIVVNTLALPVNPPAPALAGQTWFFQAWYRDGTTSNFTDAVAVLFN